MEVNLYFSEDKNKNKYIFLPYRVWKFTALDNGLKVQTSNFESKFYILISALNLHTYAYICIHFNFCISASAQILISALKNFYSQ